ncbi:MAG: SpoIIE family protein phosphatase [Christensenellales bacterium]
MFVTVLRLVSATVFPVLLAVVLYLAERKTKFGKLNYRIKQLIIGVLFGGVAVFATEFGIPVDGAVLNVRNAAPLTAGLLFGGPAGIIAGVIGGAHRWLATLWGAGAFSRVACSLACVFAGLFGAGCRKFLFENKKPSWFSGLAIGITTEVLHMLLLFVTNMNDVYSAYKIVEICALPMIFCNAVSVMLSLLFVSLIGKERKTGKGHKRGIAQAFQFFLMICVVAAFGLTSAFTGILQNRISNANTDGILKLNLADVKTDVNEASDERLLDIAERIAGHVSLATESGILTDLAAEYHVVEINIVDEEGIITASTVEGFLGYDMASGEQSAEFMCLLGDRESFVQSYRPISADGNISRKYAGVKLSGGGFVQVGYDSEQFQSALSEQIKLTVKNRHIGKEGGVIVCDENLVIVGDNAGHDGGLLADYCSVLPDSAEENVRFTATVFGKECYCAYTTSEGFCILAVLPLSEADFSRNIAVGVLMFMEIIVFAALFINVYFLIKRIIVDNIHKINGSLAQITDGNLNVQVNVRENDEFASLSDDINATVDTLKHYISEAESRIDRELEFARQIQHSSLPSVFPPYPDRKDFDIYATMDAAKEVGGDFYDFYMTDGSHVIFLVADVSGKGIPGALFMMRAKTLLKNLAESGMSIDEVFGQANTALCENNEAEMFVTAWMGKLDLGTGVLEYVNAGHNPPLVIRNDGSAEYLRTRPNFVLAGMDGTFYKKHELKLAPGDEIFLYTDGVTEATDTEGKLYGEDRLARAVSQAAGDPRKLCEYVRADVDGFVGDAEQFDDITMLCMKMNYTKSENSIGVLPRTENLSVIMEFVTGRTSAWSVPVGVERNVQLAIDEIYSNIVRYSGAATAKLTLTKEDDRLTLTFEDDGRQYDPTAAEDPDVTLSAEERKIGGLGIFLVKKTASDIRYSYERGKNVLQVAFDLKQGEKE